MTFKLVLAWGFVGIPLTWGYSADAHQRDEAVPVSLPQNKTGAASLKGCGARNFRRAG